MRLLLLAAASMTVLSGCTKVARPVPRPMVVEEETLTGWKALASAEDVTRIEQLPDTWQRLLAGARVRYTRLVNAQGALLKPEASLDFPMPPPGSYRCKLVRLRPSAPRVAPISVMGEAFCHIRGEGDRGLAFSKQTGTELPAGWLHPDGERRLILLGARQRQAGETSLAYGTDKGRDIAGVFERIAPFRWRLAVLGSATSQSLDLYELTPVPAERQAAEPS